MSTEENKAIARRRIEETWNQGNLEGWVEIDLLGLLQQLGGFPAPGPAS